VGPDDDQDDNDEVTTCDIDGDDTEWPEETPQILVKRQRLGELEMMQDTQSPFPTGEDNASACTLAVYAQDEDMQRQRTVAM